MTVRESIREAQLRSDLGRNLYDFIIGDLIGEGSKRAVFEYNLDKRYVVKLAVRPDANFREHDLWNELKHDDVSKWLAPCHWISHYGDIMLQYKTEPLPDDFKMPKKLPEFLTDIKKSNFGLLNGKLVAHDYDLTLNANFAIKSKMRKVHKTFIKDW